MKPIAIIASFLVVVLVTLNYLGANRYCHGEGEFATDKGIMDVALQYEVNKYRDNMPVEARTVEDFKRYFPNCCGASIDESSTYFLSAIFSAVRTYADVSYQRVSGPKAGSINVTFSISSCGKIMERWQE